MAKKTTAKAATTRKKTTRTASGRSSGGSTAAAPTPRKTDVPKPSVAKPAPSKESTGKIAGITSKAVEKATGRTWEQWCDRLDKAGAASMTHAEIARHLEQIEGVTDWWAQMVTVGYEQARGRREPNQLSSGYAANASRTLGVPPSKAYRAWADTRTRKRWLETNLTIRVATRDKSMRLTWPDRTSVEVHFNPKDDGRCQVVVQQTKLASAKDVAKAKAFWAEHLDKLQALLEG